MKTLIAALAALCLTLAACGSGDTNVAGPDATNPDIAGQQDTGQDDGDTVEPAADAGPMLVLTESGGCFMAGPHCRTMSFWPDGQLLIEWPVEAQRAEERHSIDPDRARGWLDVTSGTDFEALVGRLPEGQCQGCVDGIDTVLDISLDGRTITLDSMVVEFVDSEPFFAATFDLAAAVPFELDEPGPSTDPAMWNVPVEPPVAVDGFAISSELPVIDEPGRALGGGLLDASIGSISVDTDDLYLGIGRAAGCASFEHMALTPTADAGVYQLFYDTDNTCEAFGISGYRTPIADLTASADGTVTLLDTNGNATTLTLS